MSSTSFPDTTEQVTPEQIFEDHIRTLETLSLQPPVTDEDDTTRFEALTGLRNLFHDQQRKLARLDAENGRLQTALGEQQRQTAQDEMDLQFAIHVAGQLALFFGTPFEAVSEYKQYDGSQRLVTILQNTAGQTARLDSHGMIINKADSTLAEMHLSLNGQGFTASNMRELAGMFGSDKLTKRRVSSHLWDELFGSTSSSDLPEFVQELIDAGHDAGYSISMGYSSNPFGGSDTNKQFAAPASGCSHH